MADDVVDDLRALLARERRELDERAGSFRPIRPVVEEVGPRGAEHEERHAGHCGGQVLDQVEKRGLGPVDVLERHDQRLPFCLGLEELARRPEDFLEGKGGLRKSDRRREPGRDVTGVRTDDLFDLDPGRVVRIVFPQPRRIAHDLDERPECDPSSVGKTPSLEDARPRVRSAHQLLDQPGLSGTRLGDDGGEPAIAVSNALSELAQECLELVCATNQLSLVVPLDALRLPNGQQAVCRGAFRLALQLEGLHRLGVDRMADEAIGRFPKQDLTRRRGLLEACRRVDRVAGHEPLPRPRVARNDLAGIDSGAIADRDAPPLLELVIERRQAFAHLDGGPHGPESVVLLRARKAEDRHDRVTDVLLDRPAVLLQSTAHLVEIAGHDLANRLRVQALRHRRRPPQVREEDRDGLSDLRSGSRSERRATEAAESKPVRVLFAAVRAKDHYTRQRATCRPMVSARTRPQHLHVRPVSAAFAAALPNRSRGPTSRPASALI